MKKYFEMFKTIWMDQRGRALIKLGLYLIFIIIVIMYARTIYSNEPTKKEVQTVFEKYINDRTYSENITVDDKTYSLTNTNNYITFKYEADLYTVLDNTVTLQENNEIKDFELYFWNITPSLIGRLTNNKETFYVTQYNDGTKDMAYKVSLLDFIRNFDGSSLDIEFIEEIPNEDIIIIINETKQYIKKVSLDLSSYYKVITGISKKYNVQIEY